MALSISPPLIIPFLLFGGFFLNSGSVPSYFKWLSYLSWFRYGNEALLINQWADVGPGEIQCNRLNATCPADGLVVLEVLNFEAVNIKFEISFNQFVHLKTQLLLTYFFEFFFFFSGQFHIRFHRFNYIDYCLSFSGFRCLGFASKKQRMKVKPLLFDEHF